MREVASTGRHVFAIAYALFVAGSTLLPPGTDLWLVAFDPEKVTSRLVGRSAMVGPLGGGLMLGALAWRRRRLWVPRLSLPLIGYMAVCGIGLGLLVLVSQPPRYLGSVGFGALRDFAREFDALHIISYFGFAVVAAVAWRGRVSLPLIGVLLMAFGYGLEVVQEFVPKRIYRTTDLLSNGLGILLGLCWVYLYDSLLGLRGTSLSRSGRFRRPPRLARQNRARAAVQPRQT